MNYCLSGELCRRTDGLWNPRASFEGILVNTALEAPDRDEYQVLALATGLLVVTTCKLWGTGWSTSSATFGPGLDVVWMWSSMVDEAEHVDILTPKSSFDRFKDSKHVRNAVI